MSEWISVEDQLPEERAMVLVVSVNQLARGYTSDMYCVGEMVKTG